MKKEIIKATCKAMDAEGKGIVLYQHKAVPVPDLIKGESAVIEIHQNKGQIFGRIVEIQKRSPDRTLPPCPYYYACGGCQLQHLTQQAQNAFKQSTVEDLLSGFGPVAPLMAMEIPYHYRNKSHTTYSMNRGAIVSGIYEAKSHRVTSIDSCLIQRETADAIALTIRNLLPSFKLMPYDEDAGHGFLRHVLIRIGHYTNQVMVVMVTASRVFPSKANFVKKLLSLHPEITTLVMNVNSRKTSMVLGEEESVLYGKGTIEDQLCGLTFRISPKSFYQVNPEQTERLYKAAIDYAGLTGKERVLDAYSGTGTIALIAAKTAKEVLAVEQNPEAVKDAIQNAKSNGIGNVRFIKADAGDYILQLAERNEKLDVVILDPPRTGSTPTFLNALLKLSPPKIVYISCNPTTLARDLQLLTKGGYKTTAIQPVDLFPQTYHVECVVKLEKR